MSQFKATMSFNNSPNMALGSTTQFQSHPQQTQLEPQSIISVIKYVRFEQTDVAHRIEIHQEVPSRTQLDSQLPTPIQHSHHPHQYHHQYQSSSNPNVMPRFCEQDVRHCFNRPQLQPATSHSDGVTSNILNHSSPKSIHHGLYQYHRQPQWNNNITELPQPQLQQQSLMSFGTTSELPQTEDLLQPIRNTCNRIIQNVHHNNNHLDCLKNEEQKQNNNNKKKKKSSNYRKFLISSKEMERRRDLANQQERRRMHRLNDALIRLRQTIPINPNSQRRMSKIRTLHSAISYIRGLQELLKQDD